MKVLRAVEVRLDAIQIISMHRLTGTSFLKVQNSWKQYVWGKQVPHHQGQGRQDGEGSQALQGLEGQLTTVSLLAC